MKKLFTVAIAIASFCIGSNKASAQYCTPAALNCDETINNFTLNTINNSSVFCTGATNTGYTNFTSISTTLMAGNSYPFSITIGPSYAGDTVYVWVDLNHNNVFDASELLSKIAFTANSAHDTTYSSSIAIPATATAGNTRLRARVGYFQNIGACGTANYGEAEDYTLNIILPPCNGTPGVPTITTAAISGHLCNNATQTLTAVDNVNFANGIYYQWQVSTSGTAGTFTNVAGATSLTYTTPPLATSVYYRLQDSCSNTQLTNVSAVFSIPVSPSVIGVQPASVTACIGNTATISFTPNSNGLTYQWQVDSGSGFTNLANSTAYIGVNTTTLTINTVSAAMDGYNYRVVVTGGCQSPLPSSTATLTVGAIANITVTRPTTFCSGDSVILTAITGTNNAFQWYLNGGLIAGNQTYIARTGGTYSLLVVGTGGCTASASVNVTVNPSPATPVVTVNGANPFCWGNTVSLTSNYGVLTGYNYQWYLNKANIIGANNSFYSAPDSGNYTLSAIGTDGCSSTSSPVHLTAIIIPVPTLDVNNGTFCSVTAYTHYQWYMNGSVITGDTASCFTPTVSGTYYLGASDTTGCTRYSISYAVTLPSTGVANIAAQAAQVSMYPNPATTVINIKSAVDVSTVITTIDGRTVLQSAHVKTIDIGNLATGMYLVRIYNADNVLLKVEKLVKE